MYWNNDSQNKAQASRVLDSDTNSSWPVSDCFAEKSKTWIALLAIVVVGVLIFGIINLFTNPSSTQAQMNRMAQAVALKSCPSCQGGLLDSRGRCNLPGCPIYSPDWGQVVQPVPAPVTKPVDTNPILIKQVAMEIAPAPDGRGIIVHSVYGGSWAQKAGLEPLDQIIEFNDQKVKNVEQFQTLMSKAAAESAVKVVFIRKGAKYNSKITIGEGEMEGATKPLNPVR